MNIFVLSNSAYESAWHMCDKHIVKMPLETAQMLSTIHRMLDGKEYVEKSKSGRRIKRWSHKTDSFSSDGKKLLYQATMMNHPCTVWARETLGNYRWLTEHGRALCFEYTRRYGRKHASEPVIQWCIDTWPKNMDKDSYYDKTPFAQAMPDKYKVPGDAVAAYRSYYLGEKVSFAKWKKGIGSISGNHLDKPKWFTNKIESKNEKLELEQ